MKKKLIKYLTKIVTWLKTTDVNQESSIISLAPRILTKDEEIATIQPYLDELERSLAEKDLTNIAVTGAYGSGKSTIIKTFQHQHPEYEYLNISLASFKDNEENKRRTVAQIEGENLEESSERENSGGKTGSRKKNNTKSVTTINNQLERKLEISILQQIFYHVKPSKVPDSRFKRIRNTKWQKLLLIALSFIFWLISVFILFKFEYINKINPSTWGFSLYFDWIAFSSFLIFFAGVGFFTVYLVRLFSNSKINKFSIKGELELGNNIDKSVFNEHLEEIIYFFERTPYNVVVIEDLDRFNTTDIFTKLRELNILLNTTELIKRDINFIYAIRDELFTDKSERVKFFDYIIPVIPFISASNASVKLNELIQIRKLDGVLTPNFVQDIVSFIDDIDMRLLINIFHEFCIYRIAIPAEIQDNLFAMIVYKNMYPNDFGDLSKKKGNLYNFISNKDKYISDLVKQVDGEIKTKEVRIEEIKKEVIVSEKELRSIYINAIHEKIPNALYLLNERLSFASLNTDENFDKIKKATNISYYYTQYSNSSIGSQPQNSNISFSDIENHINSNFSYDERKQLIQEKHNDTINQIKKEIELLKNKKKDIESWSLKEIFQEVDIELYLNTFSNNQMMRSLLINGYIDEDYEDYISLFHEGNITRADETFKRKIKSGISSPFNYKLSDKVDSLVREIPDKYFRREVIFNFDLLDYLSENYSQNKSKFEDVVRTLSAEKKHSINFVDEYVERGKNLSLFVKTLCKFWNNWWNYISKSNYTNERKREYLKLIIENADIRDIELLNDKFNLSAFIEHTSDFLTLISINKRDRVKEILKLFGIRFDQIDAPNEETKILFDYVYENNFYEINEENICMMLRVYYDKDINKQELQKSHYSTILKSNCKSLIDYIENNISYYVKHVFLKLKDNTKEMENALTKLLNNNILNIDAKTDIIRKQDTLITILSTINDSEVQSKLIEKNKMVVSWSNLYSYYKTLEEKNSLNETLIDFLNKEENYSLLSKQSIKNELKEQTEETIKAFSLVVINCNELILDSYMALLKSTSYNWNRLSFEQLSVDKVKHMVETNFLNLTESNFNKLKEKFPNEHIKLIERQQDTFFSKFKEFTLDKDDIVSLLRSKEITTDNKTKLIEQIDSDFITENRDVAKLVCDILAESNAISLSVDIIESLVNSNSLRENKIKVLNKQDQELSDSQIQNFVEGLGSEYEKLFRKQNKPKFSNTDYHKLLFDKLQNRGLIKRYEPYKDTQLLKVFANY